MSGDWVSGERDSGRRIGETVMVSAKKFAVSSTKKAHASIDGKASSKALQLTGGVEGSDVRPSRRASETPVSAPDYRRRRSSDDKEEAGAAEA